MRVAALALKREQLWGQGLGYELQLESEETPPSGRIRLWGSLLGIPLLSRLA